MSEKETTYTLQTGCKVNLFLRILDKRPDGYHNLETFFLPLSNPYDILSIKEDAESGNFDLSCSNPEIPVHSNTITKAFLAYKQATGLCQGFKVHLQKNIPHGAGLGGGSANAAGFLLFLQDFNAKKNLPVLTKTKLHLLATSVGADVPFFLYNQPSLATGIGDKLEYAQNPFKGWHLLLVCPEIQINTALAFKNLDKVRKEKKLFSENHLTYCPHQANSDVAHGVQLHNDFEEIIFKSYPEIALLHKIILECGADFAHLSGSGSSLFGLFRNKEIGQKAKKHLSTLVQQCFLCTL